MSPTSIKKQLTKFDPTLSSIGDLPCCVCGSPSCFIEYFGTTDFGEDYEPLIARILENEYFKVKPVRDQYIGLCERHLKEYEELKKVEGWEKQK